MRLAMIGLAALLAASAAAVQPGNAQFNARWCTIGGGSQSSGEPDCAFNTLEQCRAAASGVGRYCTENPRFGEDQRGSRQERNRRPQRGN